MSDIKAKAIFDAAGKFIQEDPAIAAFVDLSDVRRVGRSLVVAALRACFVEGMRRGTLARTEHRREMSERLQKALAQWKMYAEDSDNRDIENDKDHEADLYRWCKEALKDEG